MTNSRSSLEALLARVEGAEGANRELDALIWPLHPGFTRRLGQNYDDEAREHEWRTWAAPIFTGSLDCAVTLAKRLGFYIRSEPRFHIDGERVDFISYALRPRWQDWRPDDEWFDRGEARHVDQVLSALAALLKALIAQAEADQP